MAIPVRLRPPPVSEEEIAEYTALCHAIQDASRDPDARRLLKRWNLRAGSMYRLSDFNYHGAISTEEFVERALLGEPPWVEDLTYQELHAFWRR